MLARRIVAHLGGEGHLFEQAPLLCADCLSGDFLRQLSVFLFQQARRELSSLIGFELFQMQLLVANDVLVLCLANMQRQLAMQGKGALRTTCLFVCLHHCEQRFAQ